MKSITPILLNDLEVLVEVIKKRQSGRNKKLFNRVKPRLKMEWRQYIDVMGDIAKFVANDGYWSPNKVTYINLYKNAEDPIDEFKKKLKKIYFGGLSCCPYCGLPNVNTIDHYLPKSIFPQFSFLCRNLVPSCFDCNMLKDNKLASSTGAYFLHPYFNVQLQKALVTFFITIKFDTAVFDLIPVAGLSAPVKEMIEFQIKELNLSERLTTAAKTPWVGLMRQAERNKGNWSREDIVDFLRERAQEVTDDFGSSNYIYSIVYSAVANSRDAIDFLEQKAA